MLTICARAAAMKGVMLPVRSTQKARSSRERESMSRGYARDHRLRHAWAMSPRTPQPRYPEPARPPLSARVWACLAAVLLLAMAADIAYDQRAALREGDPDLASMLGVGALLASL